METSQQLRRDPFIRPRFSCSPPDRSKSADERSHRSFGFESRKGRSDAEVDAEAKSVMMVTLAIEPEFVRSFITPRITVRCSHHHGYVVPDRHVLTVIVHGP